MCKECHPYQENNKHTGIRWLDFTLKKKVKSSFSTFNGQLENVFRAMILSLDLE